MIITYKYKHKVATDIFVVMVSHTYEAASVPKPLN